MPTIASLAVELTANTEPLERGLNRAHGLVGCFGVALGRISGMPSTGAVAGLATVTAGRGLATKAGGAPVIYMNLWKSSAPQVSAEAVTYAWGRGAVLVSIAGNGGTTAMA